MRKTLSVKQTGLGALAAILVIATHAGETHAAIPEIKGLSPVEEAIHMAPSNFLQLSNEKSRYIVRFEEAPLALYDGSDPSFAAPERTMRNGEARLDVNGTAAKHYVAHLRDRQIERLAAISSEVNRSIDPAFQYQHALNAVVLTLTLEEAASVAKIDGVASVRPDRQQSLSTDIGPGFIGAPNAWWGMSAGQDTLMANGFDNGGGVRGEGVVVGVIDTGYNSASPSFAVTDDFGYTVQNPLGSGQYIGQCNLPVISSTGCNDKVIGVYDFVSPIFDLPLSVEDINGHGSHTASTAAGNQREVAGYSGLISGVAPRANLVVYRACYWDDCYESALIASFDQAVQDTVVDIINYSISGGTDPWNDPVSLAMLAANEAGIFVAAAAGNGDQLPGSTHHVEPWVTSVAAGTHTGAIVLHRATLPDSADVPPAYLLPVPMSKDADGGLTTAARKSPNYDEQGDGCNTYPLGTFEGAMAILKASYECDDQTMADNAIAAGAKSILFVNNSPYLYYANTHVDVPVFTATDTDGDAIASHVAANPDDLLTIGTVFRAEEQPDVLAYFSLLGPAPFNVVKPDIQAPGMNILAAIANDPIDGVEAIGFMSGTSMASPHVAGAAALVRDANPEWTSSEVKSALMLSARRSGLRKADYVTVSDAFDRGAGRVRADLSTKVGLVLNESGLAYLNANPATGGDPSTLNIASLTDDSCITVTSPDSSELTCTFQRKVRNTQNRTVAWTVGVEGNVQAAITPAAFTIGAHDSRTIEINMDASSIPADGIYRFGDLVLTPDDVNLTPLRMPIAIRVPRPDLSAPSELSVVFGGTATEASVAVTNAGGPTLSLANTNLVDSSPIYPITLLDQVEADVDGWSLLSTYATNLAKGNYVADDFTIIASGLTDLGEIFVKGRVSSYVDFNVVPPVFYPGDTALIDLVGQKIQFAIYADLDGLPAGGPPPGPIPNNPPAWSFTATIGSTAGLDLTDDDILLNIQEAGAPMTQLAAGRYWLVIYVEEDITTQGTWGVVGSAYKGDQVVSAYGTLSDQTSSEWGHVGDLLAGFGIDGLQMRIEQRVACGAPWLTTEPVSLELPGLISTSLTVKVDAAQFPANQTTASAYLCLQSNDPDRPVHTIRVEATQQD